VKKLRSRLVDRWGLHATLFLRHCNLYVIRDENGLDSYCDHWPTLDGTMPMPSLPERHVSVPELMFQARAWKGIQVVHMPKAGWKYFRGYYAKGTKRPMSEEMGGAVRRVHSYPKDFPREAVD
jgi:hypothetical protein